MKKVQDILKTTGIIKASPEDTLAATLPQLKSSHDAAFVFDNKKNLLGVINPYYTIIKTKVDPQTKLEHCLFHPPKLSLTDSLERAAQMMVESKIHFLPVVKQNDEFAGIVTAHRILRQVKDSQQFKISAQQLADSKKEPIVSVYKEESLAKVRDLFKEHKISKLVIIDKNMRLEGVLSSYDLIPYLAVPSTRQGRDKPTRNINVLNNMKAFDYAKKTVLTVNGGQSITEIIDLIIDRKMGSVIITDGAGRPTGIVTTKDILTLLSPSSFTKTVKLTSKDISDENNGYIQDLAQYIQKHINRTPKYKSAELIAQEEQKNVLWKITIHLIPEKGEVEIISREGKRIQDIIKEMKEVVRRST